MRMLILLLSVATVLAPGPAKAGRDCGTTAVLVACVGETRGGPTCVWEYSAVYIVTAEDVASSPGNVARFCLATVPDRGGLCPSHSLIATVTRNGKAARSADLNATEFGGFVDEPIRTNAREGDVIRVEATQVPRNNNTYCVTQGKLLVEFVR